MKLTAKELQVKFYRSTFQRYELAVPNVFLEWSSNEMDIAGLRKSGFIDEIEIKLSRADFLADFKKTAQVKNPDYVSFQEQGRQGQIFDHTDIRHRQYIDKNKHECLKNGLIHCNYFSFLLHVDLIEKCEIPEYAGLYSYDGNHIQEVKSAPLLHRRKISDHLKYQLGRKAAFRFWNTFDKDFR